MIFINNLFSPPITGEAALQREEGSLLFYYLILKHVAFLVWLSLKASFLSVHHHAGRGIAARAQDDTGADPGRGGTDQDPNLQVLLSLTD